MKSRRPLWNPNRRQRRVLLALLSSAGNLYPLKLMQVAQVGSGTLDLLLGKLEAAGWLRAESAKDESFKRYLLTPEGRAGAMRALGLREDADDRQ